MSSFFNGRMPSWGSAPTMSSGGGSGFGSSDWTARKRLMGQIMASVRDVGSPSDWESFSDWVKASTQAFSETAAARAELGQMFGNQRGGTPTQPFNGNRSDSLAKMNSRQSSGAAVSTPGVLSGRPESAPFLGSPQGSPSAAVRQMLLKRFSRRHPVTGGRV